ncbi:hypothetical protein B0T14DRAFT_126387 [Immersiella caudata]|uniref:Uncharacterized protein n=1 Tax=Immersiella caudata TaxID=314043 RepID=A0AA39X5B1_9PEZI|nr:hypothetical protein B0T14DRAFT_126387 [Immersiella caudata]
MGLGVTSMRLLNRLLACRDAISQLSESEPQLEEYRDDRSCSIPTVGRPSGPLRSPAPAPLSTGSTALAQEPTGSDSNQATVHQDDIHSPSAADRRSDPSEFALPAAERAELTDPEGQHEVATNSQFPPQPDGDKSVGSRSTESHLTMAAAPCDTLSLTPAPQEKTGVPRLCKECLTLFPELKPPDALQPSACLACNDANNKLLGQQFLYNYVANTIEPPEWNGCYVVEVLPRLGVPWQLVSPWLPPCFKAEDGIITTVDLEKFVLVKYIDEGELGFVEIDSLKQYDPKKSYPFHIHGHTEPESDCASYDPNSQRICGFSTPNEHHGVIAGQVRPVRAESRVDTEANHPESSQLAAQQAADTCDDSLHLSGHNGPLTPPGVSSGLTNPTPNHGDGKIFEWAETYEDGGQSVGKRMVNTEHRTIISGTHENSTSQPHHQHSKAANALPEDRDAFPIVLGSPLNPDAPEGHIFLPGDLCGVFNKGMIRPAIVGDWTDSRECEMDVWFFDGSHKRTKDTGIVRLGHVCEWEKAVLHFRETPDRREQFRLLQREAECRSVDGKSRNMKESSQLRSAGAQRTAKICDASSEADGPLTPSSSAEVGIPAAPPTAKRKRPAAPPPNPNKRQKAENVRCSCGNTYTKQGLKMHQKKCQSSGAKSTLSASAPRSRGPDHTQIQTQSPAPPQVAHYLQEQTGYHHFSPPRMRQPRPTTAASRQMAYSPSQYQGQEVQRGQEMYLRLGGSPPQTDQNTYRSEKPMRPPQAGWLENGQELPPIAPSGLDRNRWFEPESHSYPRPAQTAISSSDRSAGVRNGIPYATPHSSMFDPLAKRCTLPERLPPPPPTTIGRQVAYQIPTPSSGSTPRPAERQCNTCRQHFPSQDELNFHRHSESLCAPLTASQHRLLEDSFQEARGEIPDYKGISTLSGVPQVRVENWFSSRKNVSTPTRRNGSSRSNLAVDAILSTRQARGRRSLPVRTHQNRRSAAVAALGTPLPPIQTRILSAKARRILGARYDTFLPSRQSLPPRGQQEPIWRLVYNAPGSVVTPWLVLVSLDGG